MGKKVSPEEMRALLDVAEDELDLEGTGTDEDLFRLLDPYILPAEAGISDKWLSARTGVPLDTIHLWKMDRGVTNKPQVTKALSLIGDGSRVLIQLAKHSILEGSWRVPEYVVRQPLDYDKLAAICHFMLTFSNMTASDVADGLGLEVSDVLVALRLQTRAVEESGKFCRTCGRHTLNTYCSKQCSGT